jgi:adenosine deaminase
VISQPLSLISKTLPLGDDKQLDTLINRLIDSSSHHQKRDLHRNTPNAIDARYPRKFRPNENKLAVDRIKQKDESGELEWLDSLFDEYFRFDGDYITARENKRNDYVRLCALIHPALPVAWKLAGLMQKSGVLCLDISDIRRIVENSSTNFLPIPNKNAIWSDLHVHLGGSAETSLSLFGLAVTKKKLKTNNCPSFDYERIDQKKLNRWLATYQVLFYSLLHLFFVENKDPVLKELKGKLDFSWRLGHSNINFISPKSWLSLRRPILEIPESRLAYLAITSYNEDNSQHAWLYWMLALSCRIRSSEDSKETDAILAFLNLAHLFRRDMIQDGVGLSRFVRYFRSPIRQNPSNEKRGKDGIRQLLETPQQRAEIKLTRNAIASKEKASDFLKTTAQHIYHPNPYDKNEKRNAITNVMARMHTCIHFTRADSNDKQSILHEEKRRTTNEEARKLDLFLRSASATRTQIDDAKIDLTSLIRGLDVAGDELATPIEVFAPAIRWLRREPKHCSPFRRSAIKRLHLSIHAGEDYNHLLGGLRHIDETVTFCEMGQNDRLGHALALGITPHDWLSKQPEVFVTVQEHLDNLVWGWHQAILLAGRWHQAADIALRFEFRIRVYAPLVYPSFDYQELTPAILYRSWELRRNCPIKWQSHKLSPIPPNELKFWIEDLNLENHSSNKVAYRLYQHRNFLHRHTTLSKKQKKSSETVILIKKGEQLPSVDKPFNDWISQAELDFIEVVQDKLIDGYSKLGITIEANPSSNVYISRIDDYHQHPIFRWYPPNQQLLNIGEKHNRFGLRNGVISVCVNTDDAGIFQTSLPNEFQLLHEAAIKYHEVGAIEAELWTDRLQCIGNDLFEQGVGA